jgi:hypothetical protein
MIGLSGRKLTNGGIIHPIIVHKDKSGKFIVIEGNTRTQIYREFIEANLDGNWKTIPAMVYTGLTTQAIDAIRLQAHLVGVRQWDPYSKAKYLHDMRNKAHLTFSQIVDFCGGDKREVQNYINAYVDMEKHYRPILESDQDFDPTRFSAFVELQAPRITGAIVNTGFTKRDFATWVRDRKLYPLNTVRALPRILQGERSRSVFLRSNAQEALKILDVPTPAAALQEASLELLAREMVKRINSLPYDEIKRLRSMPDSDEKDLLIDARDALTGLCEDILTE